MILRAAGQPAWVGSALVPLLKMIERYDVRLETVVTTGLVVVLLIISDSP